MEFRCVDECSQCCIKREYYPSKEYGKIGVLILAEEKEKIEELAREKGVNAVIMPRIGVSGDNQDAPSEILAYQLMGRDDNGDTCPFLDTESEKRSPHGGYTCMIYHDRPLACSAYPLIDAGPMRLDEKCKFCQQCGHTSKGLDHELISLRRIKGKMATDKRVWRYATGVGDAADKQVIRTGWQRQD